MVPEREEADEPQLIRRVQQGDLRAFEPLVSRYVRPIRALIALRAPAAHLVDELAHETFVFAFQNIQRFEPNSSFVSWLRAIAWNLLRAEIQKFRRQAANQQRYAHAQCMEAGQDDAEVAPDTAEALLKCVQRLPRSARELVRLRYEDDRSTEEIAASLQRSCAWVWTTLFRVRQQLKACIETALKQP